MMSPVTSSTFKLTSRTIIIPDLISHCRSTLHIDRNHKLARVESTRWMLNGDPNFDEANRRAFQGLKAGRLAAMCYPHAGYPQLRVCSDFLNWFFHLDNLSDDMDDRSIINIASVIMNSIYHPHTYHSPVRLNRMTKDFYTRIVQTAAPGACRRLQGTLQLFFQAIQQQALDRVKSRIPDLASYITLRRDTSGCKTTWALIEYAYHLDIPDDVMEHPVVRNLGEAANDFVAWSNDIFSYDEEQSRGQTHNMIDVVMQEQGVCLQDAVDTVGEYCKRATDRFVEDRANLPSWGPAIDADVRVYVDGLASWMAGVLTWSFETERYFGNAAKQVKATRLVMLRPKNDHIPARTT